MSKALVLTDLHYCRTAAELGCEPEFLKAVATEESHGAAFDADEFPTILFERHKFYKNADRTQRDGWSHKYPTICNPARTPKGGYGPKADQRKKFTIAFKLDPDAAMMACSWGAFQELGENYDDYGFHSVGEFVDLMKSGVDGQLEIFVRSIRHRGLTDELQRKDARGFARNYNGPKFFEFNYDKNIDAEYRKNKKHPIDCAALADRDDDGDAGEVDLDALAESLGTSSTAENAAVFQPSPPERPSPTVEPPEAEANSSSESGSPPVSAGDAAPAGDQPHGFADSFLHVEDWKPFVVKWLGRTWKGVGGLNFAQLGSFGTAAVADTPHWYIYIAVAAFFFVVIMGGAISISGVLLGMWWWNRKEIGAAKIEVARSVADPNRGNLGLKVEKIFELPTAQPYQTLFDNR
jgi:hypothetical protein